MQLFPKSFEINIVLQKLYMVIWVGCTTLKVTFPQKEQYSSFDNFKFFLFEESSEIRKFTDLAKLLFLMQTEFFQFLSTFCINSWDIHSLKNGVSRVSRSSYVVNKTISLTYAFVIFEIESTFLVSEKIIHCYQNWW